MTNTPEQPNEMAQQLLAVQLLAMQNTQAIAALTSKLDNLTDSVADLTSNVNSVLARDAILNDVLLELRENTEVLQRNFEQHQRNFDENQRTTNAALNQMNAILLQLTRIDPQN